MPSSILQCFTASSLYLNMSQSTRSTTLRILQQNLGELLQPGGAAVVATTPQDRLARTQALLLYQTIRAFDGDITLHSAGERDMPVLTAWLGDLCKIRENLGDLSEMNATAMRSHPPTSWEVG
jgi:hypothetical protein